MYVIREMINVSEETDEEGEGLVFQKTNQLKHTAVGTNYPGVGGRTSVQMNHYL